MELYDAMSTLRAVRRLRSDPIPPDVLDRVLQAAAWAPTGGNAQPWRFVVVQDPVLKQGLAEVYQPEWERYAAASRASFAHLEPAARVKPERAMAAGDDLAAHLAEAPAIVMVCFNPERMAVTDAELNRVSIIAGASVYPAVQNFMLACVAEGLGCTLTTLHCYAEDRVKELLAIPDGWGTAAMLPIGYPKGRGHGPITRQPITRLVFRDTFGVAWG